MTTAAARFDARPAAPARSADAPPKTCVALGLACALIAAGLSGASFVGGFDLPVRATSAEIAMIPSDW